MKDTLGRNNRKLQDRACAVCGRSFRPLRSTSKYCSRNCLWSQNGGRNKKAVYWWTNAKGYIEGRLWLADGTQIRVKQHRFIVEGILGRPLLASEDVHHVNGIKSDNRPENLEVLNHSSHTKQTNAMRRYKRGYSLNLTTAEREARSLRAIACGLAAMGRAAIAKATNP